MYFKAGCHKQAGLIYSPFKALIAPRPIGWISTCDDKGNANLAPYSFFNAVSEIPPMVMFVSAPDARKDATDDNRHDTSSAPSPYPQGHHAKDSLANIRQTEEFAVNIVGQDQMMAMVDSSAMMASDQDEFDAANLTKIPATDISVPLVKQAPAHLECRLYDMINLPGTNDRPGCVMVIGSVISLHIDDKHIKDGKVDVTSYRPVSRLGYKDYSIIDQLQTIEAGLKST